MPRFDDRFARQNRCEPPPEFPLASPYPGIVHHLSGPNSHAPLSPSTKRAGRMCAAEAAPFSLLSFRAGVFCTRTLAWTLDSLVRVSRRAACNHYASILDIRRGPRAAVALRRAGYNTAEARYFPARFSRPSTRCWPGRTRVCLQALPFQQFHVLFHSLFKVLFIFPSLYLFAIGLSPVFSFRWNLPPTLSCIPKQLDSLVRKRPRDCVRTGLSPSLAPCSNGLGTNLAGNSAPSNYNSRRISNLSSCRFTRRYWGNPCWFLFLRLLICLSSAGSPT